MLCQKQIRLIFWLFISITGFSYAAFAPTKIVFLETKETDTTTNKRLEIQVEKVKKTLSQKTKYNDEIAFFIDMKIHSGKNRFFVYNLKKKSMVNQGLVAHGVGSETTHPGQLKFSNVNGSLASSLGQYAIGKSYIGKFGKAYKLYGLDKTNSNAFHRNIVFHYYFDVPFEEQTQPICNSLGCPMVNEKFFYQVEKIIDNTKKPILLSIYY